MKNESLGDRIKFWFHLQRENIVGFFKFVIPILLLIFLIREIPAITRKYFLSKLDSETIGVIDSIERREGIHESETGGKIVIKSYKIDYHYLIKENRIKQSEIIDRASVNLKQRVKLSEIEKGDSILIKYDSENIMKSRIELN